MGAVENIITDNLPIWSSALQSKSSAGRGTSSKGNLYGVKKLRELVLDLAVRGLLVPQDQNDEPASVLLEKIAAEKEKLIHQGEIKKQRIDPLTEDDLGQARIPKGWCLTRLINVYDVRDGTHDSPKYQSTGFPLVTSKNLSSGQLNLDNVKFISRQDHEKICQRSKVDKGDILFAMIGSIGNAALVDIEPEFSIKNVALFKYYNAEYSCPSFLLRFLSFAEQQFKAESSGAVQSFVSLGKLRSFLIALPPLPEQHRIVAKVDELMALCDTLEQQQEDSIQAHETLVEALLEALTSAADADAFQAAWQRISEHFDVLFTTQHSIDKLKETILQLAVMGKLVPQDPKDEPASIFLEKIASERELLIKKGKVKNQAILPEIKNEPFSSPLGWRFCRLNNLVVRLGSGSTPRGGKSAYKQKGIPFLRSQNVWNDGLHLDDIAFISEETHESMSNTHVYPDDILLNITGASLGRSTIFPKELKTANVSQHVTIIRLINLKMGPFLHCLILSPYVQKLVWARQVGMAIEGLSKKVLEQFEIPVPPLAEQYRIVARVDELMALCDQLKESLQQAQQTQIHLTDAVVENAL